MYIAISFPENRCGLVITENDIHYYEYYFSEFVADGVITTNPLDTRNFRPDLETARQMGGDLITKAIQGLKYASNFLHIFNLIGRNIPGIAQISHIPIILLPKVILKLTDFYAKCTPVLNLGVVQREISSSDNEMSLPEAFGFYGFLKHKSLISLTELQNVPPSPSRA